MTDIRAASELRKKYTHFRILIIGRANAGKTTILKRVCNTTEDPHFYDEENNALLEPTSERGHHDINRPFVFRSNPEFIFHDSPGVETGTKTQLEEVQAFIEKREKATNPRDQLHAIWFCFTPDVSRFLLEFEERFFNERAGNVPVIAIFTKFDDLISQVYDTALDESDNRQVAQNKLDKLKAPLFNDYQFPPKASVTLEGMVINLFDYATLLIFLEMDDDEGKHQEYVKELIQKTAESLDNLALKMLLVSVQKNNLQLCIKYAVLNGDVYAPSMIL
ncbi:hypothetical protein C0993_008878 [Termitomyces sp. T159_Od127]|nr:hypothetical protein C0993_008878 [Termitomyces sp. T159_Od127]